MIDIVLNTELKTADRVTAGGILLDKAMPKNSGPLVQINQQFNKTQAISHLNLPTDVEEIPMLPAAPARVLPTVRAAEEVARPRERLVLRPEERMPASAQKIEMIAPEFEPPVSLKADNRVDAPPKSRVRW